MEIENDNNVIEEKIEYSGMPSAREGSVHFSRILLYTLLGLAIGIFFGTVLFGNGYILLGIVSIVIFPIASAAVGFYMKDKTRGPGSWVLSLIGWICIILISSYVAYAFIG